MKNLHPVGRFLGLLLACVLALAGTPRSACAQTALYTWNKTNFYNATHPTPPATNPSAWYTEWVTRPDGTQALKVSIDPKYDATTGVMLNRDVYYGFIIVNPNTSTGLLQSGQEYRARIKFSVNTLPVSPNYFYMYARNTSSNDYDIWRKFVDDPGVIRTVDLPLDLKTYGTGTWSMAMGMKGPGSIIIDSFQVFGGSGYTTVAANTGATPASVLPSGTLLATGGTAVSIAAPSTAGPINTVSGLTADNGTPVSQTVAAANFTAFKSSISTAKAQNASKLLIPTGVYRFYTSEAFILDGIDDLVIDGQGSEFIFTRLRSGSEHFFLNNCARVQFKNLKIDWDWDANPISSLGQVQNVVVTTTTPRSTSFNITFPDLNAAQTLKLTQSTTKWLYMLPFDSVKLMRNAPLKNAIPSTSAPTFSNLSGNTVSVNLPGIALPITNGGYYCIQHLYYEMTAFKITSSHNLLFEGVTIHAQPGMGWLVSAKTHHLKLLNSHIARRAGSRNPFTTSADGFHVNESQGNLELNGCTFTGSLDDTINIHDNCWQGGIDFANSGSYTLRLLNCPKNRLRIEVGDVLEFFGPDYGPPSVQLTVTAVTYVGGNNGYASNTYADVTFSQAPPSFISTLTIVRNTTYGNSNVRIVGNTIQYTNGRGMLLSADNVTVSSNYMRNVFNTPIQLHTEIVDNLWAEGKGAKNVKIASNTLENCNAGGKWDGAIIYAGATLPWGLTSIPLFDIILVENNVYYNCPGPAAAFNSSKNVVVRNNDIRISQTAPGATRYSAALMASNSSNLALGGNTWRFLAPITANSSVVYDAGTVTNIEPNTNAKVIQY